ncbi:MAG: dehypoxanthine futalosine cyclase [Bacteroidales bacterium]|nr:dehypoxanthine futalosine cyclase [Bacteroidales bacterium]
MEKLYSRALNLENLSIEEGLVLYKEAPTASLMFVAHKIRKKKHPENKVSWQIDRNVNITNICLSRCKFCNFHTIEGKPEAYITTIDQYKQKIEELFRYGGEQLLLQGGMHPKLGLGYYVELFSTLKSLYPNIKLHALGPPEIVHLSKMENLTYKSILSTLIDAGLDSLPGAGAEILCDRVRKEISPGKAGSDEWLDVMREAHKLNMVTSATMMFGHVENIEERVEHLVKIREVQDEKPDESPGFLAFIPWPFQDEGTVLREKYGVKNHISAEEYVRLIAISRIMLPNIENIQASWLTVGKNVAQLCLHAGANDFGSIMIEENVVSSAGASYKFDAEGIQKAIRQAGFEPQLRNQKYEYIDA